VSACGRKHNFAFRDQEIEVENPKEEEEKEEKQT